MPRPIWSGAISFGLVNIPVKLFSAVRPKDVRFHQLHDKDGVRIRQKRVCPADGQEVPYEHVVKGYEIAKDQYVILTPEELEAAGAKATHTIDIERFVDGSELDPIYFDSAYYVAPDKAATKPYALLLEAMRRSSKVAIARLVLRTKEYLVALRPLGNALALETMFFHDEVVPVDEVGAPDERALKIGDREVAMAEQLVAALSGSFDPSEYHDEYRERLEALIEKKAEGAEIAVPPHVEKPGKVVDLVAALEASLAASKAGKTGALPEVKEQLEGEAIEAAEHHAHARRSSRTASHAKSSASSTSRRSSQAGTKKRTAAHRRSS